MLREPVQIARLCIRARDSIADLVTVLVILQRPDRTSHTIGLLSLPADDWFGWVRRAVQKIHTLAPDRIALDDDTSPA